MAIFSVKKKIDISFVDWRKIAGELLIALDKCVDLPDDLAELAPSDENAFREACYAEALRQLGEEYHVPTS